MKSSFFVFISWQAEAKGADCTLSSATVDARSVTALFAAAKTAAQTKTWSVAETCLAKAHALSPTNRDVQFFAARVQAFQGHHDAAQALVEPFAANDRESQQIRGDLAWYRGDFKHAAAFYQAAVNSDDKAPADLWTAWIKALVADKRQPEAQKILTHALAIYPNDEALKELKKSQSEAPPKPAAKPKPKAKAKPKVEAEHDDDAADTGDDAEAPKPVKVAKSPKPKAPPTPVQKRFSADAQILRESQDQSAHAYDVEGAVIVGRKSLAVGATIVSRDYGNSSLTDTPLYVALGYGWVLGDTTVTYGGSPSATFTSRRFGRIDHELPLTPTFSLTGQLGFIDYSDLYVRVASLGAVESPGNLVFRERVIIAVGNSFDRSAYAAAEYHGLVSGRLVPSIYVAGGRDAASRPYLSHTEDDDFRLLGVRLSWDWTTHFGSFAQLEDRREIGYYQNTLILGVTWKD